MTWWYNIFPIIPICALAEFFRQLNYAKQFLKIHSTCAYYKDDLLWPTMWQFLSVYNRGEEGNISILKVGCIVCLYILRLQVTHWKQILLIKFCGDIHGEILEAKGVLLSILKELRFHPPKEVGWKLWLKIAHDVFPPSHPLGLLLFPEQRNLLVTALLPIFAIRGSTYCIWRIMYQSESTIQSPGNKTFHWCCHKGIYRPESQLV